jgi:hypothetical protein
MVTILIHLNNADPVKLDVDEIPKPADHAVLGKNPRERGDREVDWLEDGVTTVMFPWWRINFIEVLPSESEDAEFPLPFRTD